MRTLRLLAVLLAASALPAQQLQPHTLAVAPGKNVTLNLPAGFDIHVAASGLRRPRFFAKAPDGRIFVTTMFNLADNTQGTVSILDGYDASTHRFARVTPFLTHLRNPNNLAFYTDDHGATWLYVPLTDRLVRFRFHNGDTTPSGPAEVLMRFPDYGLNYKYGGWHLTRTVAIATLHGKTQVYVASGSSCNYCEEREAQRASVIAMDPDGGHPRIVAHGLRNAVDLEFIPGFEGGALLATNMGDDHLGDKLPEDTFFALDSNEHPRAIAASPAPNFGWPTCYFAGGKPVHDTTPLPANPGPGDKEVAPHPASSDSVYGRQKGVASAGTNLAAKEVHDDRLPDLGPVPQPLGSCEHVPAAFATFPAHSSPLGFAWFGDLGHFLLQKTFLVALHGAGHTRIGTGYKLITVDGRTHAQRDFLTGFLTRNGATPVVHGRPCGILRLGPDHFLLTDDKLGLVYEITHTGP